MVLNIKNEAVHRDARRLAVLTGKSLTAAVRDALAARLAEVEHEHAETAGDRSADATPLLDREAPVLAQALAS